MQDVSGFGLIVNLVASVTFPAGLTLSAFADDADPLDMPSTQLKDKAVGLNGDMLIWSKPTAKVATLNLIPRSEDDDNMQVLAKANSASRGRRPVQDEITMTVTYPDGRVVRCVRGAITDAIIGDGVASAGRLKTKPYIFAFEEVL